MNEEINDDLLLKPASAFTQEVLERFYPPNKELIGDPLHWNKLNFRIFPGEESIWTGINGHGKSLFLDQMVLEQAVIGKISVIASFEMPARKTLYRMARQALGKADPSVLEIQSCMKWLGSRVFIYDKIGTGNVEVIRRIFNKARAQHKVTFFVIDSLMKCGIDPDDYKSQKRFVDLFQNFAQDYGVNVNIVAHARKGKDEDDKPGKMDIKGASEITDLADNVFSIWRNKKKENLVKQWLDIRSLPQGQTIEKLEREYDCMLECSKHREMGGEAEGQYGLFFHKDSMQFTEYHRQEPMIYFEL